MIFITGGAFQGKRELAADMLKIDKSQIVSGETCSREQLANAVCVSDYQLFIAKLLKENIDPVGFTEELIEKTNIKAIIMNEVGCGIIPIEKDERKWRELVGMTGCMIAQRAEAVIRVSCGIPVYLKGEKR